MLILVPIQAYIYACCTC